MENQGSLQPGDSSINPEEVSKNLESSIQNEIISNMPDIDISISEVIDQISSIPLNEPGQSNVPGPSNMPWRPSRNENFNIESIRPLPKALPRVESKRKRLRKPTILTDTPVKLALEEEAKLKLSKKMKTSETDTKSKTKGKGKGKGERKEKVKNQILQDDSEEDARFCLVCAESYNEDTSGLDWIQCILCKKWVHITCVRGDPGNTYASIVFQRMRNHILNNYIMD